MIIRAWEAGDEPAVNQLLGTIWGQHSTDRALFAVHGADQEGPRTFRRSLIAVDDGRLIGVGTLWETWLHPRRWRVTMHVSPAYRRQGTGSLLLTLLRAMRPDTRPLQTATRASDPDGCRFFKRHGFSLLMRTRRGTLHPAAAVATISDGARAAAARLEEAGHRFLTLPELPPRARPEVARLHAAIYHQDHAWDPPVTLSDDDAAACFLAADDLIPGCLHLALAGPTPVAVASLRSHPLPDRVELGWVGVAPDHAPQATDLTLALTGRCLTQAAAQHCALAFEIDEAATHLWPLFEQLPADLDPDWLTFAEPDEDGA
jgi:GNAT superfamily N-acetyltransferase